MVTIVIGGDPLEAELEKFEITENSLIVVRYARVLTTEEARSVGNALQHLMEVHDWKAEVLLLDSGLQITVLDEEQMAQLGWMRRGVRR